MSQKGILQMVRQSPKRLWVVIYSCGAQRIAPDAGGGDNLPRCCNDGGHPFEIVEYVRKGAPADEEAAVVKKPTLRQLQVRVARCTRCSLAQSRHQTVFARGSPVARVCFVGEAPGAEEDAQGQPFVGRAGKLLDEMIEQAGLAEDAYICNIVKCRPPGNRRPTPEEISACSAHLHDQLTLWQQSAAPGAAPAHKRIIVALGNTAISTLLGTNAPVSTLRGQWKLYRGRVLLMPTYHPSFLMRPFAAQARCKQEAASDLLKVAKELGLDHIAPKTRRHKLYAIPGGRDLIPG